MAIILLCFPRASMVFADKGCVTGRSQTSGVANCSANKEHVCVCVCLIFMSSCLNILALSLWFTAIPQVPQVLGQSSALRYRALHPAGPTEGWSFQSLVDSEWEKNPTDGALPLSLRCHCF